MIKSKLLLLIIISILSLNIYPQSRNSKVELLSIIEDNTTYETLTKYLGKPDNIINKKKEKVAGLILGGYTLYEYNKKGIRIIAPDKKPGSIITEVHLIKPFSDTLSNGLFIGMKEEDAINKCNSLFSLTDKYLNTPSQYSDNSNYYVYDANKINISLTTSNGIVEKIGISKNKSSKNTELDKFRDASFGISTKEVKSIEKAKFVQTLKNGDEETLIYSGIVGGLNCDIYYFFINNKFLMGAYYFTEEHTNKNLYIDDYKSVLNILKDKYGKPNIDDYEWLNDLYKDDVSEWGFAVSLGHLKYNANWKFSNGSIFTVLKGDNYKISHIVRYATYDYEIQKEEMKKTTDEF